MTLITFSLGDGRSEVFVAEGASPPVRTVEKSGLLPPLPNFLGPEGSRPSATFAGEFAK